MLPDPHTITRDGPPLGLSVWLCAQQPAWLQRRGRSPASSLAGTGERLAAERVSLFRSLFVGRDDVYAKRWEKDGRKGGLRG